MRLYLYLALALILSALLYGAVHVWRKAERVDVAEAKQHQAEQRALDVAETAAKAAAQERGIAQAMTDFRGDLGAQTISFNQALTRKPLTVEVTREVNGVPVTCRERDPVRYRELYNQAVTGVASP